MATDAFAAKNGAETRTNLLAFNPENLTIIEDKAHPLYDERVKLPLDEYLVSSIMANGVLAPVLVNRDGGALVVVDGRQRVRAAAEAARRLGRPVLVPAIFKRGTGSDLFGLTIATNELRTPDSPTVRAQKMQRLFDLSGGDVNHVALSFGVPPHTVRQSLALLEASPEVQQAVDEKRISLTGAAKISKETSRAEQAARLTREIGDPPAAKAPKAARAYVRRGKTLPEIRAEIKRCTDAIECEVLSVEKVAELNARMDALRWVSGEDVHENG